MTFITYKSTRSICPLSFIQIHSPTVAKFRNKCDACNTSTTSVAKPGIGISDYAVLTSNIRFQFRLPNIIVCCPMFILVPFLLWSYGGPYRLKKVHQTNLICCLKIITLLLYKNLSIPHFNTSNSIVVPNDSLCLKCA